VRTTLLTVLTTLTVASAAWCGPKPAANKPAAPAVAAPKIDIRQWPAFQGAVSIREAFLDGPTIAGILPKVSPKERAALEKLRGLQIKSYRLNPEHTARAVFAFYEPKVLAAGYKSLMKDTGEGDDDDELTAVAIYAHPGGGLLVIALDGDEDSKGKSISLDIVSVAGTLSSLADLGKIQGLAGLAGAAGKGPAAPKPAPAPTVEP
jgi:hypothetical protein